VFDVKRCPITVWFAILRSCVQLPYSTPFTHTISRGGRLPGSGWVLQYPALPETGRGYFLKIYGRIRVMCHDFSISQLHRMLKGKARIWPASVFKSRHCGVTSDRSLPTCCFVEWGGAHLGAWESTVWRINQSSDTRGPIFKKS